MNGVRRTKLKRKERTMKTAIKGISAAMILVAASVVAFGSGGLAGVLAFPMAFSVIGAIYNVDM